MKNHKNYKVLFANTISAKLTRSNKTKHIFLLLRNIYEIYYNGANILSFNY